MAEERVVDWRPSRDPQLFEFYAEGLFEPGWAGSLSDDQAAFVRDVLTGRAKCSQVRSVRRLRRAWGMRPWQDYISDWAVREVAMFGRPDDPGFNMHLVEKSMLADLLRLIA